MNCIVRKATAADAGMISMIGKRSFRDAFGKVFDPVNLDAYLESVYNTDNLAASIRHKDNSYLVATNADGVIGFAKMKIFSLNDSLESVSQMQLEKIYVLPGNYSNGAGTALLVQDIHLARRSNPDYLWLDVWTGNEKGIRFYERQGFRKEKKYYQGFGSQFFEFFLMTLPLAINREMLCTH